MFVYLYSVSPNDPKKLCGRKSYPDFRSFRKWSIIITNQLSVFLFPSFSFLFFSLCAVVLLFFLFLFFFSKDVSGTCFFPSFFLSSSILSSPSSSASALKIEPVLLSSNQSNRTISFPNTQSPPHLLSIFNSIKP